MKSNKKYKVYLSDLHWNSVNNSIVQHSNKGFLRGNIVFCEMIPFEDVPDIREITTCYLDITNIEKLDSFKEIILDESYYSTNNDVIKYK